MNLVYNVPCTGVVRAKTHCDILQLSKSDTSHVLHHFPDSNATPFSSYSCMLPLFLSLHFRYISYLFCLLMSIFHLSFTPLHPSTVLLYLLQFSCTLSHMSSSSYFVSISVTNKMKEGIKHRCDAAFNKTVSGSCDLDQQFRSVIRLEEESGPHTNMMKDTRTSKSDIQRSPGRMQR